MSDLPASVHINEEGPREGFQFEKGPIPTARKIELIDALSQTGLDHIQIVSFVNPKAVPGMADADEVVRGITPRAGRRLHGAVAQREGLRARAGARDRLDAHRHDLSSARRRNFSSATRTARLRAAARRAARRSSRCTRRHGVAVERGSIMAAFGCNFEGDIPVERVVDLVAADSRRRAKSTA